MDNTCFMAGLLKRLENAINRYLSADGNHIVDEFRFGEIEKSSQRVVRVVVYPSALATGNRLIYFVVVELIQHRGKRRTSISSAK